MEDTNETKKINNAKSLEEKFAKKSKEINYSIYIGKHSALSEKNAFLCTNKQ